MPKISALPNLGAAPADDDNLVVDDTSTSTTKKVAYSDVKTDISGQAIDDVATPEDWTEPSLSNSWVNYGGGWSNVGYYKDKAGTVHLRGLIKSGTLSATIFTLPVGYRPNSQLLIGTISNNAIGRVRVNTNGTVVAETPSSNTWVALDGITFRGES